MRAIGEIESARNIGYRGRVKYIWLACLDCGKQRWVNLQSLKRPNYYGRCKSCDGKAYPPNPKYNGRHYSTEGYIMVQLHPDDFFYPMAEKNGYVKEHRLIMAKSLGRCLAFFEVVHHWNGVVSDNRRENLSLETAGSHAAHHNSLGVYRGTNRAITQKE